MSTPSNKMIDERGYRQYTPEDYNPIFKRWGVS